ncbi:VCBS repeat-containing protein [Thermoflexibacter ruber]|uniref:Repeat domain-containing protein n=1 Tax=Thermoflexibacter ruber TaxID=1003 RepID=A0A1I2HEE0_9BACT|nr:FG-GAP-like repeat-containing protein [Thermoflexibacter ruber]SFF28042.1 Repeat domain-containing protein [Thermoflexibacter ruber]
MKVFTQFLCKYISICFLLFAFSCSPKEPEKESMPVQEETKQEETLFTLLSPNQTNINFQNTLEEGLNTNILMYEYFYNGGGTATADFNGDGLIDIYFVSNMGENKFYLNKGKMVFEDVTEVAKVSGEKRPWKTGVTAVDINADGKLDLYLCYSGALPPEKRKNQLFINQGNNEKGIPIFEEKAEEYGLASVGFSNQAYFFDYDLDHDLDMLLLNHNPKNLPLLNEVGTAELLKQDSPEMGLRLFKQDKGKFTDVTTKSGINGSELSYGLGIGISDFNEDGYPDFYLSNDYSVPDYYYINNKNGTFSNQLTKAIGHISQFSMGNDVADINNDGFQDIFTLDMLPEDNARQKLLLGADNFGKFDLNVKSGFYYQYMRNMLQLNNGNGTFSEIGQLAGISNTDWSWSALFADYDNDGWKDLFITNGYVRDYTNMDFIKYMDDFVKQKGRLARTDVLEIISKMPASNVVNYIFKNNQGITFSKQTQSWGMNRPSNSNGAAYADLDNDGDLDLVVNNINQTAFIYENNAQKLFRQNYIQLKLNGLAGNTQGIGAKVKIFIKGKVQVLEQSPAKGYLSSVSPILHFGLGENTLIDTLQITWIGGKAQLLTNVTANQVLVLEEKNANAKPIIEKSQKPIFQEATSGIDFVHAKSPFRDFDRQSLLLNEFSHIGTCFVKDDLNKDGLEDVYVGGGFEQAAAIYFQEKNGTFKKKEITAFEADKKYIDADAVIFDANGDGNLDIYVASGGYHNFTENDENLQDRLYLSDGKGNYEKANNLPKLLSSKSCVRASDLNNDGFIDLFVGGRVVAGKYPETPESYVLINDGKGNFTNATQKIAPEIQRIGMVTDAIFADLDGDKINELVIVGEFMPIKVFSFPSGTAKDASSQYFEKEYKGFWNKIAIGDFNGDSKPDFIVGNIGKNVQFNATDSDPAVLYYDDFDQNGQIDPIFTFNIQGVSYPYVSRDELQNQMPLFRRLYTDFKSYSTVSTPQLFKNGELEKAKKLSANFTETTCFLSTNTGRYVQKSLPIEVQYSPIYAILVFDYDKDGKQDLILGGNSFYAKLRLGKFDANYGILLKGYGQGEFQYINQRASGLNVSGDVRSIIEIKNKIFFGVCEGKVKGYKIQ